MKTKSKNKVSNGKTNISTGNISSRKSEVQLSTTHKQENKPYMVDSTRKLNIQKWELMAAEKAQLSPIEETPKMRIKMPNPIIQKSNSASMQKSTVTNMRKSIATGFRKPSFAAAQKCAVNSTNNNRNGHTNGKGIKSVGKITANKFKKFDETIQKHSKITHHNNGSDRVRRMSKDQLELWEKDLEAAEVNDRIPWVGNVHTFSENVKKGSSRFEETVDDIGNSPSAYGLSRSNSGGVLLTIGNQFENKFNSKDNAPVRGLSRSKSGNVRLTLANQFENKFNSKDNAPVRGLSRSKSGNVRLTLANQFENKFSNTGIICTSGRGSSRSKSGNVRLTIANKFENNVNSDSTSPILSRGLSRSKSGNVRLTIGNFEQETSTEEVRSGFTTGLLRSKSAVTKKGMATFLNNSAELTKPALTQRIKSKSNANSKVQKELELFEKRGSKDESFFQNIENRQNVHEYSSNRVSKLIESTESREDAAQEVGLSIPIDAVKRRTQSRQRPQSLEFYQTSSTTADSTMSSSSAKLLPWSKTSSKRTSPNDASPRPTYAPNQYEAVILPDRAEKKKQEIAAFFQQSSTQISQRISKTKLAREQSVDIEEFDNLFSNTDLCNDHIDDLFSETLLKDDCDLITNTSAQRRHSITNYTVGSIDNKIAVATPSGKVKRSKTLKGSFKSVSKLENTFARQTSPLSGNESSDENSPSPTAYSHNIQADPYSRLRENIAIAKDYLGPRTSNQASTQKSSYTSSFSTQSSTTAKGVSPFNKFQQLDSQHQTTRRASGSGGAGGPGSGQLFALSSSLKSSANSIKDVMLQWCQCRTRGYKGIKIENFSTSWNDGMAFCALIHHFYPDAFDFDQLNPKNRRYNFDLAFKTADDRAGVMALLDVEDMVVMKKPDWKCVFTYIQSLYKRLKDE